MIDLLAKQTNKQKYKNRFRLAVSETRAWGTSVPNYRMVGQGSLLAVQDGTLNKVTALALHGLKTYDVAFRSLEFSLRLRRSLWKRMNLLSFVTVGNVQTQNEEIVDIADYFPDSESKIVDRNSLHVWLTLCDYTIIEPYLFSESERFEWFNSAKS